MNWLKQALTDSRTSSVSSKRLAMLLAVASMSVSLVILACAAYVGRVVDVAITGLAAALAGIGGGVYVGGKAQEAKRKDNEPT